MCANSKDAPPLALTMGEPAGIGGELTLQAWLRRSGLPVFCAVDDPRRLAALARQLGWRVPIRTIEEPAQAASLFADALPVLPCPIRRPVTPGRPDIANNAAIIEAITKAVALARSGQVAAIVTNPIHKAALAKTGFAFPGHTEFLADLAGSPAPQPVMMLSCPGLRVIPVTVHCALAEAVRRLNPALICSTARIAVHDLRVRFGLASPRLAVAALNPHAGEAGHMGREEIDIIAPAIERLRAEKIDVFGPVPADTLFHAQARATYDAALCMYHDQALIPLKTIDFAGGVNITLGLPFIRTSPDHGVAFDIAGSGRADPSSLIAALREAARIARCGQGDGAT